jgi:hypothetical protein
MKNLCLVLITIFFFSTVSAQSTILAREFAHETAERLMEKISPITGDDVSATIHEIEYDYEVDRYIIDMSAKWTAQRNWFANEEPFIIRGILKVGKKGQNPILKEMYRNKAVNEAWSMDDIIDGVIILTALTASLDE